MKEAIFAGCLCEYSKLCHTAKRNMFEMMNCMRELKRLRAAAPPAEADGRAPAARDHRPLLHATPSQGFWRSHHVQQTSHRETGAMTWPRAQSLYKKGNRSLHVESVFLSEIHSSLFSLLISYNELEEIQALVRLPPPFHHCQIRK